MQLQILIPKYHFNYLMKITKSLPFSNFLLSLFFNTLFRVGQIIESGISCGVSWKANSSHKLVNALHLPPLLRRHHKIQGSEYVL